MKYRGALLLCVIGLGIAGTQCSGSNVSGGKLAAGCTMNSQCDSGLICTFGRCHAECKTSDDCPANTRCVLSDSSTSSCQLADERICHYTSECKAPLVCGGDGQCRNECKGTRDCTPGQTCSASGTCAEPVEVDKAGNLIGDPMSSGGNGGSGGSAQAGASSSGGGSESGGSAGEAGALSMADAGESGAPYGGAAGDGASGATSGGSAGSGATAGSGGNGGSGGNAAGGGNGGGAGSAGNGGSSSSGGFGGAAPGNCGAATCTASQVCAGAKCSCIADFSFGSDLYASKSFALVLRTDGTVWGSAAAPYTQVMNGASPLTASQVVLSSYYDGSASTNIGCALSNGSVWCFPLAGTLGNSAFLGAGLGTTDATSDPVQVVTSVGGPALTGVSQITAASTSESFCALTSAGEVWCWGGGGQGQLGHGDTSNSNFARRVIVNLGGTPFSGAVEVRAGSETTCARKTDGSVWCWGTNADGEFGVMPSALASSYYPVQVALPDQQPATRLTSVTFGTYCAILADKTIACWGENDHYEAAVPTGNFVPPTRVLLATDGDPLMDVIDVTETGTKPKNALCVRTASYDMLCWGTFSGKATPIPFAYTDSSGFAVTGIHRPLVGSYGGPAYLTASGAITLNGTVLPDQPPCN